MPVSLGGQAPASFDLKSSQLPLLTLLLKSVDTELLRSEFEQRYGDQPGFFDHDPLVIDLQGLAPGDVPDLAATMALLRRHRLSPVLAHSTHTGGRQAALSAGLALVDSVRSLPDAPARREKPAPEALEPATNPGALVIDKPLRSGQQVYARGRDLVVMAMVNPGAEVIADGHIHVYAPLRGKAMAGARGQSDARIFALSMAPELISIAGVYRTSEVPLPAGLHGQAAQVRLTSNAEGDRLVIEALSA